MRKNLNKFCKKKKGTSNKKWLNDNPFGFYKYGKTDCQIRDCPI